MMSALVALAVLAGCSDSGMLAPTSDGTSFAGGGIGAAAIPTPADVVVPGTTAGSFANAIVADNSGRATTEFWDNISADDVATNACNIGFYATGNMAADCLNQAPGSTANSGGFTSYWGDGAENRDPSAFTFDGDYSYTVTLVGSYAGSASEVGWFTKIGGVYQFHPVLDWSNRTIGTSITVNTSGDDWGFYIKNAFNAAVGGCASDGDCSDAEGGFAGAPHQQFALMINADGSRYLVGVEDEALQLMPNGEKLDSDYNDYIFTVEPTAIELLNGRMTGGGRNAVSSTGAPVTFSFTLHCDITLSNNIEISWAGQQFHIAKPITLAACSDDPAITQQPPRAPLDTFYGEADGRLNGVDGARVEFTLVDGGEGQSAADMIGFVVYDANDVAVLTVPFQSSARGNIQAHYDQPHGQTP
jgi:hypothetical protein